VSRAGAPGQARGKRLYSYVCGDEHRPNEPTAVVWHFGGTDFTTQILEGVACPHCGKRGALVALPQPMLTKQTDGTTHACAPFLGGCNRGYELVSVVRGGQA
jgi:DNA-directed RNA polymerase subunit RPC12/RpoP